MAGRGTMEPVYVGTAVRHLLGERPAGEDTQKWLADAAGLNVNAVAKIVRNEAEPSSRVLFALADALGTTCGRLRELQATLPAAAPRIGRPKRTDADAPPVSAGESPAAPLAPKPAKASPPAPAPKPARKPKNFDEA